jgi:hypothetical protein
MAADGKKKEGPNLGAKPLLHQGKFLPALARRNTFPTPKPPRQSLIVLSLGRPACLLLFGVGRYPRK